MAVKRFTAEECAGIIERLASGESANRIAADIGCAASTITRMAKRPELAAILSERRAVHAASAKIAAAEQAESAATKPTPAIPTQAAPAHEPLRSADKADGKLLGIIMLNGDNGMTKTVGMRRTDNTYNDEDAYRRTPRESTLRFAAVATEDGTFSKSFEPSARSDVDAAVAFVLDVPAYRHLDPGALRRSFAAAEPGDMIYLPSAH